jgi:ferric-dicitrate binding protein FerR (iron transport regulator)
MYNNSHKYKLMNSEEFHKAETGLKIVSRTATYRPPFETSKEDALKKVKMKIAEGTPLSITKKSYTIKIMYWAATAAACIVLTIGIWQFWFNNPTTSVTTAMGQHSEMQLPDGSLVSVNAASKVTYNKKVFAQQRTLNLDGEAFFKVKKGSTFTVETLIGKVEVLGTSFNVFARENNFKVSCATGKVRVTTGSASLTITPGESALLENNVLVKRTEKNPDNIGLWLAGEFNFENSSLKMVFKEIERQYNVNFVLPDLEGMFFTGSFSNKNLTETLDIVCIPMGLTYEIGINGNISISQKKD